MSTEIGVSARRKNRKLESQHVLKKANELILQTMPPETPLSGELFLDRWKELEALLVNSFGENRDFKLAFNRAVHTIESYREEHNWQVSAPAYLLAAKPEKQTKNKNWLQSAWLLDAQYRDWLAHFIAHPPCKKDVDKQFQAVLLSFICQSGHCSYPLILAFAKALNQALTICSAGGLPLITLRYEEKGFNTNVQDKNGFCATESQCYLSPFTLGLIHRWQSLDKTHWQHPTTHVQLYDIITIGMDKSSTAFPKSLKKLTKIATYIVERTAGVNINQALCEYISGRTKSYSLPSSNLARINSTMITNEVIPSRAIEVAKSAPIKSVLFNDHSDDLNDLYYQLKQALKKKNRKQKRSPIELKKALLTISNNQLSLAQQALLSWYIYKLETTCKPKTIANYHSLLTRRWLFAFEGESVADLSHSQIHEIYQGMIEKAPTPKVRKALVKRISDLHAYCVAKFNFPALLSPISDSNITNHTRSAFIDEALFNALLQHIDNMPNLTDDDKATLKCIAIISFRCGLRIGELKKLMLKQIEISPIGWMQVRSNQIGDNKKPASLRKVPLYPMLTETEKRLVADYINRKNILSKSPSSIVFTLGSDTYTPFSELYVSSTLSTILRTLSQLDVFVFHHFRHSCLSRLQLMIEVEDVNLRLPNAVPYSNEQCQKITNLLCGQSLRNRYYAISSFDGHSTPVTCFSNYFHFSDWIIAYKLSKTTQAITKKENIAFGLTTKRQLISLQNALTKPLTIEHCLPSLIKKLHIRPLLPQLIGGKEFIKKQNNEKQDENRISLILCYDILKKIEEGFDIEFLALEFDIDVALIQRWLNNATYLKTLTTTRSAPSPRHSSPASLLPGKPQSAKELATLDKMIIKLKIEYKTEKKELIKNMLDHALTHQCKNQSGITFQWPEDLEGFLNAFANIVPKNQWRIVTYTLEHGALVDEWELACKNIKTRKGKKSVAKGAAGKGHVRLELIHPQEKEIKTRHKQNASIKQSELRNSEALNEPLNKKVKPKKTIRKYSSNALSFMLFMMGVRIGNW